MTPEWSHLERVDTIGEQPRGVAIAAGADQRTALARRFGLVAIDRLEALFELKREGDGVIATGRVSADVTQACSITDDPLPALVNEQVELRFVEDIGEGEEVELSEDALDTMPIENGAIDLGEAAAETMALALDPFPRSPGAAAALKAAGVIGEDEVTPFNAFAALKNKLGGA
jgi:uncharacterized metal-binding protein YceD (DUF177 family)